MFIMRGKHNIARIMLKDEALLDEPSRVQIQGFLNSPAFAGKPIAIMPDVHYGKGSCVGFTMPLSSHILPAQVGVDIGCGCLAANFGKIEVDVVAFDSFVRENIPSGHKINTDPVYMHKVFESFPGYLVALIDLVGANHDKSAGAISSLGGGNHFGELDRDEEGNLWCVIHSGSRNLGLRVAEYFMTKAQENLAKYFIDVPKDEAWIPVEDPLAVAYLDAVKWMQGYAETNREAMMWRVASFMHRAPFEKVQSVHNYIDFSGVGGSAVIRKGAISAKKGERCIIPFNMAEGSALCVGKGNPEWNYSAPHGAGRLLSRTKAKASLNVESFVSQMAEAGVYSTSVGASTLDEAPGAYKDKQMILDAIEPTVSVVSWLKPFYNFKASS